MLLERRLARIIHLNQKSDAQAASLSKLYFCFISADTSEWEDWRCNFGSVDI